MTPDDVRGRGTVSVEEAAQVLGIGRRTAYQAAKEGTLPVLAFGRRLRVPVAQLLAMLGEPNG